MEKITGIGGFFFKAKNPDILSKWYEENIGIKLSPKSYDERPWYQDKGPTCLSLLMKIRIFSKKIVSSG